MKITLILPYDSTYRFRQGTFKRSILYPPLTLTILAALVPPDINAAVRIIDEGAEELPASLETDIVGISTCTATAPRAYELAARFRRQGVTVVLGGVHPTILPEEAAQHADAVVIGMAEKSWPRLLRDFKIGQMKKIYDMPLEAHLPEVPFPRRDLLHKDRYLTTNTVMATRGCPNRCRFCSIPVARQSGFYARKVEDVVAEIKNLPPGPVIFLDPSPTEDERYIEQLYQAMIPLRIKWVGLSTVRVAQNEKLLSLAVRSGCVGLLMGFETISQSALRQMSKGFNHVTRYKEIVRRLHARGIGVMACIILGFDEDGPDVFKKTLKFIGQSGVDLVRYTIFTPFPGTEVYQKLEETGRILDRDWGRYDYEHVVFQPARMSARELQAGFAWLWTRTYTLTSIVKQTLFHPHLPTVTVPARFSFRYHARRLAAESRDTAAGQVCIQGKESVGYA